MQNQYMNTVKRCLLKPIIDVLVFILDDMACVEVMNVTFDNYFLANCLRLCLSCFIEIIRQYNILCVVRTCSIRATVNST